MDSFELKGEEEFNTDFKPLEIIQTERKDFYTLFSENKTYVYSILFYIAGLLSGSFIYKNCQNEVLNKILNSSNEEFLQLLINNLSIYLLVFAVSVLLGVCLVGFPIINAIPYIIGFEAGMKIAYYYISYGVKGVGYSLLMVAPYVCLFLTVVIYSVSMSFDLSKQIYHITVKKSDMSEEFNYKTYLKRYLAYAGLIAIVAVVNTAVCTALNGIISI
ncbi:MAG: stage II sporulation protein M [Eubacterium sp.]|nr:stage II sporulation protein M [Eubacterium sp.]